MRACAFTETSEGRSAIRDRARLELVDLLGIESWELGDLLLASELIGALNDLDALTGEPDPLCDDQAAAVLEQARASLTEVQARPWNLRDRLAASRAADALARSSIYFAARGHGPEPA